MGKPQDLAEEEKNLNVGEETSVDSPSEGEEEISKPKAAPETGKLSKSEGEVAPKEEEVKPEVQEKKKPTRAEKRLQQLLGKLKEASKVGRERGDKQPQAEAASEIFGVGTTPPWQKAEQSPFQPGQEVSLDQLEAELNRRAATMAELKARQVVEQERQRDQLLQAIEKYADELEQLQKEVPDELDEKLTELIVAVNSDEKGQFVPKKSPLEIYEAMKAAMEKAKTQGQVETTTKMAKSMAEAAVSPSASTKKRLSSEEEIAKALEKGEITAEEAEELLPKVDYGY